MKKINDRIKYIILEALLIIVEVIILSRNIILCKRVDEVSAIIALVLITVFIYLIYDDIKVIKKEEVK